MLQPRYFRSSFIVNPPVRQVLPTGKGFGGSNLAIVRDREQLVSALATSAPSVVAQPQSPLVFEFTKILFLGLWLWCLMGANFCANSVTAIANVSTQDA
jgi:hypothetical protein